MNDGNKIIKAKDEMKTGRKTGGEREVSSKTGFTTEMSVVLQKILVIITIIIINPEGN